MIDPKESDEGRSLIVMNVSPPVFGMFVSRDPEFDSIVKILTPDGIFHYVDRHKVNWVREDVGEEESKTLDTAVPHHHKIGASKRTIPSNTLYISNNYDTFFIEKKIKENRVQLEILQKWAWKKRAKWIVK